MSFWLWTIVLEKLARCLRVTEQMGLDRSRQTVAEDKDWGIIA